MEIFNINKNGVHKEYDFVPYEKISDETGKNAKDETLLEELIFNNPKIFPVGDITGEAKTWIPLARQINVKGPHGTLDIIATDDMGNFYIVECKLRYNTGDMKTIRGQISDYASGIYRDSKDIRFDSFWKWLCNKIEDKRGKSLEKILEEYNGVNPLETIEAMKKNFKENNIFLIFVVDQITSGLYDTVEWHNNVVNTEHNFPCFVIEVRKYVEKQEIIEKQDENEFFVRMQIFPFNFQEIVQKKEGTRLPNNEDIWNREFNANKLDPVEKEKILEFKEKLKILVKNDGGFMNWGSGGSRGSRMMPRFKNYDDRSPIGLRSDGILMIQFGLIRGSSRGPEAGEKFHKKILEIKELSTMIPELSVNSEPQIKPQIWLPYDDKILSILEEIFLKNN